MPVDAVSVASRVRFWLHITPLWLTVVCFGIRLITAFLISNFRRVLYVVCFLLGNSPAYEFFYAVSEHCSIFICLSMKMEQSVPKRRHIKFRRRGITQKKTYNIIISLDLVGRASWYISFIDTNLIHNFYINYIELSSSTCLPLASAQDGHLQSMRIPEAAYMYN